MGCGASHRAMVAGHPVSSLHASFVRHSKHHHTHSRPDPARSHSTGDSKHVGIGAATPPSERSADAAAQQLVLYPQQHLLRGSSTRKKSRRRKRKRLRPQSGSRSRSSRALSALSDADDSAAAAAAPATAPPPPPPPLPLQQQSTSHDSLLQARITMLPSDIAPSSTEEARALGLGVLALRTLEFPAAHAAQQQYTALGKFVMPTVHVWSATPTQPKGLRFLTMREFYDIDASPESRTISLLSGAPAFRVVPVAELTAHTALSALIKHHSRFAKEAWFVLYERQFNAAQGSYVWQVRRRKMRIPRGVNACWYAFLWYLTSSSNLVEFLAHNAMSCFSISTEVDSRPRHLPEHRADARRVTLLQDVQIGERTLVARTSFGSIFRSLKESPDGHTTEVLVKSQRASMRFVTELVSSFFLEDCASDVAAKVQLPVRGIGQSESSIFFMMPSFHNGVSLSAFVQSERLSLSLSWLLMTAREAARAVALLHAAGIVHNDVMLRNFLVEPVHATTRIADLGLSVALAQGTDSACFVHDELHWGHCPPEFFTDGELHCSRASDVFQFGWMLFSLLTGSNFADSHMLRAMNELPPAGRLEMARSERPDFDDYSQRVVLASLAQQRHTGGSLDSEEQIAEAVRHAMQLVVDCLNPEPSARPSMAVAMCRLAAACLSLPSSRMLPHACVIDLSHLAADAGVAESLREVGATGSDIAVRASHLHGTVASVALVLETLLTMVFESHVFVKELSIASNCALWPMTERLVEVLRDGTLHSLVMDGPLCTVVQLHLHEPTSVQLVSTSTRIPEPGHAEFENMTDPLFTKALAAALCHDPDVQCLTLRHSPIALTGSAMQSLCDGLSHCTHLRQLELPHNSIGAAGVHRLVDAVLQPGTCLELLNLRGNSIESLGARALASLPGSVRTRILLDPVWEMVVQLHNGMRPDSAGVVCVDLLDVTIDLQSAVGIADALKAALGDCATPCEVHVEPLWKAIVSVCLDDPRLSAAFLGIQDATVLNLGGCDIGLRGAEALSSAFMFRPSVHSLSLYKNSIGDGGAELMASVIAEPDCQLERLNLSNNGIGPPGAEFLAEGLKANTSLTHVNLGYNSIRTHGAQLFARALLHNTTLQVFNVYNNLIEDTGSHALVRALFTNRTVTLLDLSKNSVSTSTKQIILDRLQSRVRITGRSTSLEQLKLLRDPLITARASNSELTEPTAGPTTTSHSTNTVSANGDDSATDTTTHVEVVD